MDRENVRSAHAVVNQTSDYIRRNVYKLLIPLTHLEVNVLSEKTKTVRMRIDPEELNIISIALSVLETIPREKWRDLLLELHRVWSWQDYIRIGEHAIMDVDKLYKTEEVDMDKLEKTAERFRIFGLEYSPQWWSYKGYEEKRQKPYYPRPRRK